MTHKEDPPTYREAKGRVFVLVTCHVLNPTREFEKEEEAIDRLVADIHEDTKHRPARHHLESLVDAATIMHLIDTNQYDIGVDVTDPTYGATKLTDIRDLEYDMSAHCAEMFPTHFVLGDTR